MNSELSNLVWEQKFRPDTVAETILPTKSRKEINDDLNKGVIPNYLFSGASGVGKTTLARAIANHLEADLLYVNASLDNGIDILRTNILQFVSTVSFSDSKKIVLLDEADHLSNATQPALRGFLDEFSSNATFIFTCNHKHRIIDALISRLTVIDFKFSKEERKDAAMSMLKRCCQILDGEGITYDKKAVAGVVAKNFPDFRKTLGELQRYSASGTIDSGILALSDDSNISELSKLIKGKDFTKCRQWIANNQMDSATFYRAIYDKILPDLVPATVPQIILIIAEYQHMAQGSIDIEINQIAAIIKIMQSAVWK